MPKQVRFRCVHLTSYGFLQTLPLASSALAIRITFPLVWVVQVSCNLTGLPASLGKQKNAHTGVMPSKKLSINQRRYPRKKALSQIII